jgi:hypothetical protein
MSSLSPGSSSRDRTLDQHLVAYRKHKSEQVLPKQGSTSLMLCWACFEQGSSCCVDDTTEVVAPAHALQTMNCASCLLSVHQPT